MTRAQTRCAIALFLVILVTWPLASLARPGLRSREGTERLPVEARGGGVFSELRAFLVSLWGKEGSSVDPSGNHGGNTPNNALPHGGMEDGGSSVDPSGHA
jgi:hypothetical protein